MLVVLVGAGVLAVVVAGAVVIARVVVGNALVGLGFSFEVSSTDAVVVVVDAGLPRPEFRANRAAAIPPPTPATMTTPTSTSR